MKRCVFFAKRFLALVLTCSTVSQVLGTQFNLSPSLLELQHSPSPYECALLCAQFEQQAIPEGGQLSTTNSTHILRDWVLYKILQEEVPSDVYNALYSAYQGKVALYLNEFKKQVVLVYQGIDLVTLEGEISNKPLLTEELLTRQINSMEDLLGEALAVAHQYDASLTITGHSLGGWLAQLTSFKAQQLYPEIHVKVITFDSPGAKPFLEAINVNESTPLDDLDITNYLATPNLLNTAAPHIGTLYQVVFKRFKNKANQYTVQSYALKNFLCAFNPNTGIAYQCAIVQAWPLLPNTSSTQAASSLNTKEKALLDLLITFQRASQTETTNDDKTFLQLIKKALRYRPKPFAINSKPNAPAHVYIYKTRPFDARYLSIRHVPKAARQFLLGIHNHTPSHVKLAEQYPEIYAIQWNHQKGFISIAEPKDIRLVVDQLISLAAAHPELCAPISLLSHLVLSTNTLLPPPAVAFFVGREMLLRKLTKCFAVKEPLVISSPITGPGGIGKSQLAIRVMAQQALKEHYEHIFWIPAESEQKLLDAYLQIAEDLNIYVDKKDIKRAVERVRYSLQGYKCLYVFDDAPDIASIEAYLPLQQGHVLITSRNSDAQFWPVDPVVVDKLDEGEAMELAQKLGYGESSEEQTIVKTLLAQVPSYPLFLVQLFKMLADEGLGPEDFLAELRCYASHAQEQKFLEWLAENPYPEVGYDKRLGLFYVFKQSLEKLCREEQGGQALDLLSQLSYLDPKGVPVDFVLSLNKEDDSPLKRRARALLLLLEKYSLVQWDRTARQVYIHAETQLVTRNLYPQLTLTNLVNSLTEYVGDEAVIDQNAAKWSSLLPHGRMLFARLAAKQYPQEACRLVKYLAKACEVSCLFQEGVDWAREGLTIAKKRYPSQDHPDIAEALSNLGWMLAVTCDYRETLKYQQQALNMLQGIDPIQKHPRIARSLGYVGWSLAALGNYQEALEYHRQGLQMLQWLYPDEPHPHIAWSLLNIGSTLENLGLLYEALKYNKQALEILKQLYKGYQACPDLAWGFFNTGRSLLGLGDYSEALAHLRCTSQKLILQQG